MQHRLPALDWMRGIAMVLMLTDHASEAFNASRPVTDSVLFQGWDTPLDSGQFFVRWLSHLCAPVFLFLAGTSLALSIERKRKSGVTDGVIDRDLLIRGLVIAGVDLLYINWLWLPGILLLQVMYAIGLSMIAMIGLRRLGTPMLLVCALVGLLIPEWMGSGQMLVPAEPLPVANALLVSAGFLPIGLFDMTNTLSAYPVVPWCAMMAMGWALGRYLLSRPEGRDSHDHVVHRLLQWGAGCLAIFVVLRGLNGFGNLDLVRLDHSLTQWLHVSKYPPSLTFAALELGIMFVLLSGLFRLAGAGDGPVRPGNPVLVFGQTAFFFYVVHILMLETAAHGLDMYQEGNLGHALVASAVVFVAIYPLCLGYRRLKSAYPRSVLRFF